MLAPASLQKPYSKMAKYYDLFYHHVQHYEYQCDFLQRLFQKHASTQVKNLLDVGCGTGTHALILAIRGYDVTGIDISEEMLDIARGKVRGDGPRFYHGDMRDFKLDMTFDAILVLFGGFGYLTNAKEVSEFLEQARVHLQPAGLLIYEFWQKMGIDNDALTAAGSCSWQRALGESPGDIAVRLDRSKYDANENCLSMEFYHYVFNEAQGLLKDAFLEVHSVQLHTIQEMSQALEANAFKPLAFYSGDAITDPPLLASKTDFRVICLACPVENNAWHPSEVKSSSTCCNE